MEGQVIGGQAAPFLVCTACYQYAREPKMAWRGLSKPCAGSAGRAKTGSRAQARTDLMRRILPAAPKGQKEPFGDLVAPAAGTRQRWAVKLGVDDGHDGAAEAPASRPVAAPPAAVGSSAETARSSAAAAGPAAAAGLIVPPLAAVARAHGFESLAEARLRGLQARASRAAAARGREDELEGECSS